MEFSCFAPEFACFVFEAGLGCLDQAQKKLSFASFFAASADSFLEILPRNTVIRFAVIRSGAHTRSHKLTYQTIVDGALGNLFREFDYLFSKLGGPLLKVKDPVLIGLLAKHAVLRLRTFAPKHVLPILRIVER